MYPEEVSSVLEEIKNKINRSSDFYRNSTIFFDQRNGGGVKLPFISSSFSSISRKSTYKINNCASFSTRGSTPRSPESCRLQDIQKVCFPSGRTFFLLPKTDYNGESLNYSKVRNYPITSEETKPEVLSSVQGKELVQIHSDTICFLIDLTQFSNSGQFLALVWEELIGFSLPRSECNSAFVSFRKVPNYLLIRNNIDFIPVKIHESDQFTPSFTAPVKPKREGEGTDWIQIPVTPPDSTPLEDFLSTIAERRYGNIDTSIQGGEKEVERLKENYEEKLQSLRLATEELNQAEIQLNSLKLMKREGMSVAVSEDEVRTIKAMISSKFQNLWVEGDYICAVTKPIVMKNTTGNAGTRQSYIGAYRVYISLKDHRICYYPESGIIVKSDQTLYSGPHAQFYNEGRIEEKEQSICWGIYSDTIRKMHSEMRLAEMLSLIYVHLQNANDDDRYLDVKKYFKRYPSLVSTNVEEDLKEKGKKYIEDQEKKFQDSMKKYEEELEEISAKIEQERREWEEGHKRKEFEESFGVQVETFSLKDSVEEAPEPTQDPSSDSTELISPETPATTPPETPSTTPRIQGRELSSSEIENILSYTSNQTTGELESIDF